MPQSIEATLCPEPEILMAYASGSLAEADAESLLAHLESCTTCQGRADELALADDSLLNAVRGQGLSESAQSEDGQLRKLIEAACGSDTLANSAGKTKVTKREDSITLDVFVNCLHKSQLVDRGEIETLVQKIKPADTNSFAKALVSRKRLTPFQAKALKQGRYKGLVLGNYIVLEKLGEGGMGHVFKARHRRMGRIVCLKVLRSSGRKSPEMVERFKRETRAVASLNHPNIVVAHDADESDGIPFLVMEYIEGLDLSQYVKKHGEMPASKVVPLMLQAAQALAYAHDQGVVHRDIKPHNLLLDTTGSVKILDMGLARFDSYLTESPDASTHAAMTNSGVVMGTVDYMSPEQAMNCRNADARSDIYSLGCTLYFMLTGKPLYDGQTVMERLIAHREKATPWLANEAPGVSLELAAVFQKMVAKEAEDRYQSMNDLIDDLGILAAGGTPNAAIKVVEPALSSSSQRSANKAKPWRAAVVAGTLAFVVGIACALAGSQYFKAAPETADASTAGGDVASVAPPVVLASATSGGTIAEVDAADETPSVDEPALSENLRSAGGAGRALVVLPYGYFYEDHYLRLSDALKKRGIEMVTASTKKGTANPKHDKCEPVEVDITMAEFKPHEFDAVFFLGGDLRNGLIDKHDKCESETKWAISEAVKNGVLVASVGDAKQVVNSSGICKGCEVKKVKNVEVCRAADDSPGKFLAISESKQSETLVHLIFDQGGMVDSLQ